MQLKGRFWAPFEGINTVSDTVIERDQNDEEILAYEISDEELEIAAGASASVQGASSLWSTVSVAGCTCLS